MAARLEKQVEMIEGLYEDKKKAYQKIDDLRNRVKEAESQKDKAKKVWEDRL